MKFLAEADAARAEVEDLGEDHANSWKARNLRHAAEHALGMGIAHALLAIAVKGQPGAASWMDAPSGGPFDAGARS